MSTKTVRTRLRRGAARGEGRANAQVVAKERNPAQRSATFTRETSC